MRKNLSRLLAGALACISVLGLVGCGGNPYSDLDDGGNKRPEKVLDPSKTQLQVVTFRAGFGDEWLYELEDRFEEAYKDVVYEDGKKGVQVWHEGDTKQYDAQAVISSKYDIFFMEGGDYYALCANGGALEELTDIVTLPNKDDNDKTIFSKMTAQQKSFYGYTAVDGDPKYYAIPHYEGGWGLVYNKELFDRKGYYLASKAGEEPCLISSPDATSEKGTGPDGQTGTEDDGLPRTYEEFFFLCDEIVARDDIPFCWSGKHAEPYLTTMMNTLVADYNGVEQMTLNLDFNGTAQELVVMNGNEIVYENGKIKTETKEITPANGYDMARQVAKYYAIGFLYRMLTEKGYYNDGAFVSTHDHLMAQTDFLQAGTTFASGKHDQEEALAISDRIAVMKDGNIMQIGTPNEIYAKPQNPFVAGFIGVSNFLDCQVDGDVVTIPGCESVRIPVRREFTGKGKLSARPEQLFFSDKGLAGKVLISTFLGDFIEYEVELADGQTVVVNEYTKDTATVHEDGKEVFLSFDPERVSLYVEETGEVLSK